MNQNNRSRGSGLIIAAAVGYDYPQLAPFILSALQNTRAEIILLLEKSQTQLISTLSVQARLHPVIVNFTGNPREMVIKRFFLLRTLIANLKQGHNPEGTQVLLSDSRDVFFQDDPFQNQEHSESSPVVLAEEPTLLKDCQINRAWIETHFGTEMFTSIAHHPVDCAGTIAGSLGSISTLLEGLCSLMEPRIKALDAFPWGLDQAALNVLAFSDNSTITPQLEGIQDGRFLTLYHQPQLSLDRMGKLLNASGMVFPVVHQYDRLPWLSKHLLSMLLTDRVS